MSGMQPPPYPVVHFSDRERAYYQQLYGFAEFDANGRVGGLQAANFLSKSGVDRAVLKQIWDIADVNEVGWLGNEGFSVALRLVAHAQTLGYVSPDLVMTEPQNLPWLEGMPPPAIDAAPPPMGGDRGAAPRGRSPTRGADRPVPNDRDCRKYARLFLRTDKDGDGYVSGAEAMELMTRSGLDQLTLGQIWDLSDGDHDGYLSWPEFVVAMHLIRRARAQQALPPSGSPAPPDLTAFVSSQLQPPAILSAQHEAHSPGAMSTVTSQFDGSWGPGQRDQASFQGDASAGGFGAGQHEASKMDGGGGFGDQAFGGGGGAFGDSGFGTGATDFGTGATDFGTGATEFGTGATNFGSGVDGFGTGGGSPSGFDQGFDGGFAGDDAGGFGMDEKKNKKDKKDKKKDKHAKEPEPFDTGGGDMGDWAPKSDFAMSSDFGRNDLPAQSSLGDAGRTDFDRPTRAEEPYTSPDFGKPARRPGGSALGGGGDSVPVEHFEALIEADKMLVTRIKRDVDELDEELTRLEEACLFEEREAARERAECERIGQEREHLAAQLRASQEQLGELKLEHQGHVLESVMLRCDHDHFTKEAAFLRRLLDEGLRDAKSLQQSIECLEQSNQSLLAHTKSLEEAQREVLEQVRMEKDMLAKEQSEAVFAKEALEALKSGGLDNLVKLGQERNNFDSRPPEPFREGVQRPRTAPEVYPDMNTKPWHAGLSLTTSGFEDTKLPMQDLASGARGPRPPVRPPHGLHEREGV